MLLFGIAGFVICGAAWWQGHAASATTTADEVPVLVTATVEPGLSPGRLTDVTFLVDNPSRAPVHMHLVELVALTVDHEHAACPTADFSMAPVVVDEVVASGASAQALTTRGVLHFAETGLDQNACQGASLSLYLAAR